MRARLCTGLLFAAVSACANGGDRPSGPIPPTSSTGAASTQQSRPGGTTRVMPLGDSITQGDAEHDTYRRALWLSLMADGFDVDFVGSQRENHRGAPPRSDFDLDHEGHWGFRVDEILARARGWAESGRPDVVLIHLGSNDLFQNQSVDSTLDELEALIGTFRRAVPGCVFLLAQIIPTRNQATNQRIRDLNAAIPALAARLSTAASPVRVVDQFTGFDAATHTYDGVHPNADGEIHLSDRWLRALREILAA